MGVIIRGQSAHAIESGHAGLDATRSHFIEEQGHFGWRVLPVSHESKHLSFHPLPDVPFRGFLRQRAAFLHHGRELPIVLDGRRVKMGEERPVCLGLGHITSLTRHDIGALSPPLKPNMSEPFFKIVGKFV